MSDSILYCFCIRKTMDCTLPSLQKLACAQDGMGHFMLAPLLEMGYQNLLMELLVAIPCLNEDKTIRNVIV